MKIFTDSDPDGYCATWVVSKWCVEQGYPLPKVYPMNYGIELPLQDVRENEVVFILDFSISPEIMEQLLERTPNVYWIDHHVSAMDKFKNFPHDIPGRRDIKYSSCENAHLFLHGENAKIPEIVSLVGDFDIWRENFRTRALPFIYGIQTEDISKLSNWDTFAKNVNAYEGLGKKILAFLKTQYKSKIENAFESEIDHHSALVLNSCERGVFVFEEHPDKDKFDVQILYYQTPTGYSFSIYSTHVDVSKIASRYGGGGHKEASGFRLDYLPFWMPLQDKEEDRGR